MTDLFVAAALALALEGTAYALFPAQMKRLIEVALATDENSIRLTGLVSVILGVMGVWFVRG